MPEPTILAQNAPPDDPKKHRREADHIWHVWMNSFAASEKESGREWPRSIYEFKSLIDFLSYGARVIEQAYTKTLPSLHQQCSHSAPEPIMDNCAKCCLGVDVTKCDILVSIKNKFDHERGRTVGSLGKYYESVPDSEMYRVMTQTCAWHIYKTTTSASEEWGGVDTSEGHILTTGDRMYWSRLYESLSAMDEPPFDSPEVG